VPRTGAHTVTNPITIVGGFYREICRFPPSDEYWGSGGRAAAAIAESDVDTNFVTVANPKAEMMLASVAQAVGFKYSVERIPETITFRYQHGLSTPIIWPPLHTINRVNLRASGDCVLQFGMLEAKVQVDASTVIYDPQEPFSPAYIRPARKPSRLAYVLNGTEARRLSGNDDVEVAARRVAQESGADVVIVKRGALGALVFENGITQNVPAFETRSVWPIGSGDVFAAIFAAQWGVHGLPAMRSAMTASMATAAYVEERSLPIQRDVIEGRVSRRPLNLNRRPLSAGEYDVYLAGPFFNMSQLWLVDEALSALRGLGVKVFSPYHDVGIGKGEHVAPKDIEALEKSRAVLAILDGVDTGTIFESGYARAHGKPVVAFTESTPQEPLKMISGTGCEVVNDFVSAIYHAAWAAWR
jgi:nucleoside 2-deoxyribosyltransferase